MFKLYTGAFLLIMQLETIQIFWVGRKKKPEQIFYMLKQRYTDDE